MMTFLIAFCISITIITGLALTICCGDSKNWIGLYPDGTYLLNVDGKDVLVVWQTVDGENE